MKTSKFFFSTLIAAAAMTASAYAEDTVLTYDDLFLSEDGWSLVSLRNRANFSLNTENETLSLTNSNWGQSYAAYELDSRLTATESTSLTFSIDLTKQGNGMYSLALIGTTQVFCVGLAYGSDNISYAVGSDATHTAYGFGSNWDDGGSTYLGLGNGTSTGASLTTGDDFTVSGEVSYVDDSYRLSLTAGNTVVTYDLGSFFDVSKLAFAGDGANDTANVTFSNLSLSGAGLRNAMSLAWAGTDGAIWKHNGSQIWTNKSDSSSVSFINGDSVEFDTADASVMVDGEVFSSRITVSADTKFTGEDYVIQAGAVTVSSKMNLLGEGVLKVNRADLFIEEGCSLYLEEGVTLDLGRESLGTLSGSGVSGEGTIVWGNTGGSHGTTISLSDEFQGTLKLSGYIAAGDKMSLGGTKKLLMEGVWLWGGGGRIQNEALEFVAAGGTNTFEGGLDVKSLNITGGTATISGTNTAEAFNITGGTATISGGSTTISVDSTTTSGDPTTIPGEISVSDATLVLSAGGKDGALRGSLKIEQGGLVRLTAGDATGWGGIGISSLVVNEGGELKIETNSNTGPNQTFNMSGGITLQGGKITGEHAYSKFDLYNADTGIKTLASSTTAEISAAIGLRKSGVFDVARGTTENGIDLHVSGMLTNFGKVTVETSDFESALTKKGDGTLMLSGDNQYWRTGAIIESGTVVAAHANALGTGAVTLAGGDLDIRADVTLNELNGTGAKALTSDIVNKGKDEYTLRVRKGDTDGGIVGLTEHDEGLPSYTLSLVKFGNADDKLSLRNYLAVKNLTIEGGTLSWSQKDFEGKDNWGSIEKDLLVKSEAQFELVLSDSSKEGYALSVGGDVNLASGAEIVVDLSGVKAGGEEIVLNIIAANAINFGWTEASEALIAADGYSVEDFVSIDIKGNKELAAYVNQMWNYSDGMLSLTLAIPEPSMFGLLAGLGALALAGTRRRRK